MMTEINRRRSTAEKSYAPWKETTETELYHSPSAGIAQRRDPTDLHRVLTGEVKSIAALPRGVFALRWSPFARRL